MTATVKRWGNSAAIRIPASLIEALALQLDDDVEIREESGRIIIEPIRRAITYRIEDLVAAITPENLHQETDFGPPQGKEVW